MSAELKVALDEFKRNAERCVKETERTYSQFINGKALEVASRAIKATEKADANLIAYVLAGNVSTRIRVSKKTGKEKRTRQYDVMEGSLAARIVNSRLVARGEKPIWGRELVKAARKLIAARIRAVAFVRSGWVYAVRQLAASVGYSQRAASGDVPRLRGQAKGYAIPARTAISSVVTAEIGNTSLIQHDGRNPMRVANDGLAIAIRETSREMLDHLAKKLQPVLKQFSAK